MTHDQQTGIAVFGVGRWGVHLLRNFLEQPQARVLAVIDPDRSRLAAVAEQFSLDEQVILAADWSAVPPYPQVEAVAIATPAMTHYSLITTALKRGYHVLAEKPLTLMVTEALDLCRLAQQQQRQLVVDHTYLFHPAVARGREVIQGSLLGDLRYGYATRTHLGPVRQDVDVLWDLAIHDIAVFNTWLDQTPYQVQAKGTVWLQPQSNSLQPGRGVADLVWVTLHYPNGFHGLIQLCWLNPDKQRRIGVVGNQGTLVFDELSAAPLTLHRGKLEQRDNQFRPVNQHQEVLSLEPQEPLQQVCQHFLACVRQNIASQVSSGWVGAELVQILSALAQSLQAEGQPVRISPVVSLAQALAQSSSPGVS